MTATRNTLQSLESLVTQRIRDEYSVPSSAMLTRDTSLLDSGIIDSSGYLELFKWVEEEFGLSVSEQDMVPSNFETIGRIAAYIEQHVRTST
jgi:acyl carrier protein